MIFGEVDGGGEVPETPGYAAAESADRARGAEDVVPLWDRSACRVRARSELGARGAAAAQARR
jgi:hypothetical protein